MTRKLGSLLGEAEYVARRKQLANVAFRKLWTVWFRRTHISLQLRLRVYASFVIPVLTYNMGTWGLTPGPKPAFTERGFVFPLTFYLKKDLIMNTHKHACVLFLPESYACTNTHT